MRLADQRDGFHDLRDWVMEHGPSAGHELSKCMDKLVPIIMDSTKDAHHQVGPGPHSPPLSGYVSPYLRIHHGYLRSR